jgi:ABC-type enterochelin transport system ATPase subunit
MFIGLIVTKMNGGQRQILFVPMRVSKETKLLHDFPVQNTTMYI